VYTSKEETHLANSSPQTETGNHRERRPQPRRAASHRQLSEVMFWQSPQRNQSGQSNDKANHLVRPVSRYL
jgi:hypothetical protein